MKYFIINTTIFDGEYEYFSQSPYSGRTLDSAVKKAEADAHDWTKNDWREYEVTVKAEITKAEYDLISKYIY